MSFPTYPSYKDSGIDGLGGIPAHWRVVPLGREAWVRARLGWKGLKAEEYLDDGYAMLSTPCIKGREIDFGSADYISKERFEESPEIKLRLGDVLLAKDGSTLGTANFVGQLPRPATVNGSIAVVTPRPALQGAFLRYLFESAYFQQLVQRAKGGMGVPHLFQSDLNKFRVVLPPVDEQHLVTTFLDGETAKIDALVAEQKRLIEFLKEKRQAVISHAVTKGLHPDAPMKPSGIEWIGDIPQHWYLNAVRRHVSILSGYAFPSSDFSLDDGDPRLLRGVNVGVSTLRWEETVRWKRCAGDGLDDYELRAGDLVIGMDRPLIADGMRVAQVQTDDLPCLLLQRVARLASTGGIDLSYLELLLASEMFVAHFAPETTGVSVPHISPDQIRTFVIPVPPVSEQREVVTYLQDRIQRLESLAVTVENAVQLLTERRAALVAAAVTGLVDVRHNSENREV